MPSHLLVLDDVSTQLDWLIDVFRNQGFELTGFIDGASLLEAVKSDEADQYSAALLDLILRKNDDREKVKQGGDYCQELKQTKPYIPVFAITRDSDPQRIANTMLTYGFDGFIAKEELRTKPAQYANHLRSVIANYERYPQLKSAWRGIARLINFRGVIEARRLDKMQERLRKAYFYLIASESNPLLKLLLPTATNSFNESILQSAMVLEEIINHEYKGKKSRRPAQLSGTRAPKVAIHEKIKRVTQKGILGHENKDELNNIFEKRQFCAHASRKRFDKVAALDALVQTLNILTGYLERKKAEIFPTLER